VTVWSIAKWPVLIILVGCSPPPPDDEPFLELRDYRKIKKHGKNVDHG